MSGPRGSSTVIVFLSKALVRGQPNVYTGSARGDLVADLDLPVAEHVGAQAALVDERSERAGLPRVRRQAFEVCTWLAQPLPHACHATDRERLADEGVEVDPAGDQVPAGLLGSEAPVRKLERIQHFRFD